MDGGNLSLQVSGLLVAFLGPFRALCHVRDGLGPVLFSGVPDSHPFCLLRAILYSTTGQGLVGMVALG